MGPPRQSNLMNLFQDFKSAGQWTALWPVKQNWGTLRAENPCPSPSLRLHQRIQNCLAASQPHDASRRSRAQQILPSLFHVVAHRPGLTCGSLYRSHLYNVTGDFHPTSVGILRLTKHTLVRLSRFHRLSYIGCLIPLFKETLRRIVQPYLLFLCSRAIDCDGPPESDLRCGMDSTAASARSTARVLGLSPA